MVTLFVENPIPYKSFLDLTLLSTSSQAVNFRNFCHLGNVLYTLNEILKNYTSAAKGAILDYY